MLSTGFIAVLPLVSLNARFERVLRSLFAYICLAFWVSGFAAKTSTATLHVEHWQVCFLQRVWSLALQGLGVLFSRSGVKGFRILGARG